MPTVDQPFNLGNLLPSLPPPPAPPGPVASYDTSERETSWIYFIQVREDGPIRIGTTMNLARCLRNASFDNHEPVRLIGAIPMSALKLDDIDRLFGKYKMHGQWHRYSVEIVSYAALWPPVPLDDGLCVPSRCAYCAGHSPESAAGIFESRARSYAFDDLAPHRRRMATFDSHPGVLAKDAPKTWTDQEGNVRRTALGSGPLGSGPSGRALRALVFQRDGNRCQWCKTAKSLCVDHVITWRVGGANHPDNLRVLCDSCNSVKAGITDVVRIYGPRE